jgi:hypothetical protein
MRRMGRRIHDRKGSLSYLSTDIYTRMRKILLIILSSYILLVPMAYAADQKTPKSTDCRTVAISLSEVQKMLSAVLTRKELEKKLGPPCLPDRRKENWGILSYEMSDGKHLSFWFKGSFITEARFDRTDILGVSPPIAHMFLNYDLEKKSGCSFWMRINAILSRTLKTC